MFLGHFGVALGAKRAAPRVSLGTLFLAAQFTDLLWPLLLLLGLERVRVVRGGPPGPPLDFTHYPISHSLLAVAGWGLLLALVHFGFRRDRRAAAVIGLAVVSHWVLDLFVHHPDLPLYPGGPRAGLGLWSLPAAALALELALFGAGLALYLRATAACGRAGSWSLWALVALLALVHGANILGPPPPSARAVAWAGQAQWLIVAWGFWIDRHRRSRPGVTAGGRTPECAHRHGRRSASAPPARSGRSAADRERALP